jgi:hypothetical protein
MKVKTNHEDQFRYYLRPILFFNSSIYLFLFTHKVKKYFHRNEDKL